jgi:hypothetical protein
MATPALWPQEAVFPAQRRYTGMNPADFDPESHMIEAGLTTCTDGTCNRIGLEKIPLPKARPRAASMQIASASSEMSCGQQKLLKGAMDYVRRQFGNRSRSRGGCGAGVGGSILNAGFPFPTSGRNAINYMNLLPDRGWKMIPGATVDSAPPGSVLIFSGPCTSGYPRASGRCRTAGDWVGHVTIKGNPKWEKNGRQYFYTDGRTPEASPVRPPRRRLVGVFLPPGSQQTNQCER